MTQGDVNAAVSVVIGTGVTLWAAQIATGVLFGAKVKKAAEVIETRSKQTLGLGALVGGGASVAGLILVNVPNGLIRLIGIALLVGLLGVGVLGSAGLAFVVGQRLLKFDLRLSLLGAVGRGAALLILAGFLPVIGWFLLFPVQLLLSVGAGSASLWSEVVARRAARAAKSSVSA